MYLVLHFVLLLSHYQWLSTLSTITCIITWHCTLQEYPWTSYCACVLLLPAWTSGCGSWAWHSNCHVMWQPDSIWTRETQSIRWTISTPAMISSSILTSFCLFAALARVSCEPLPPKDASSRIQSGDEAQGPLPLAFGSPLNVEEDVDCVVKNAAWEYAKKLLPRVSHKIYQF